MESFLRELAESGFKELSPHQVMFLLEFSLKFENDKVTLVYTPHRFLHRYCRSTSVEDQKSSKEYFVNTTKLHESSKMYLCHCENGKSHAFAAMKKNESEKGEWILLDSLVGAGLVVPGLKEMFDDYHMGARASVLVIPDGKRVVIPIGE